MATALTLLLLPIPIDRPRSRGNVCPAIGNKPHNCRPIVGPIAYSVGYHTGYRKELSGTQTGRSKHCGLELRIEHTQIVITTLLLRPSTFSLGHNKDRQRLIRGFSAGLEGRAAWMKNGELELIVPRRAVFERLRSPTLKQ